MDDLGFTYRVHKDGKVFLLYHGKLVRTLDGEKAAKFVVQVDEAGDTEAQLIMAKITGNFKRGNEKQSAKRSRT
jgi:hypothetical protein